jgi:dephospho-CoA kinase
MSKNTKIIGITGGMGCGQTLVTKFLGEQGAKTISADYVAHKIVDENPDVKNELKKVFGRNIYTRNGKLKRKFLANIVFKDENKVRILNRIIQPPMVGRIIEKIEQARESGRYSLICVDATLIFETNLEKMFDSIIVVSSKMSDRIERIKMRDGLSNKEITERIRKQIPVEDKARWADFVIKNDDSIGNLKSKTRTLYRKLTDNNIRSKSHPRSAQKRFKKSD